MNRNQLSRRQRYTIQVIEDAYFELLNEKAPEQITVLELCQRAEINRTTFYRYYKDIQDLIERSSEELFHQIFSVLELHMIYESMTPRAQILHALNVTEKNKTLCKHILYNSHTDLAEKVLEDNLLLIKDSVRGTGCTEMEAELCYSYLCGGLARLWIRWIEQDCSTPKEKVALIIEQMLVRYYETMENGFILLQP